MHLPPPARAARPRRLSTRTEADGEEEGGGGRGRKGEGKEAESRGGSPGPGALGTRCEGVRFPLSTPLPAAGPSPATPPPQQRASKELVASPSRGVIAQLSGARSLIYIFLCQALSLQSNLALFTPDLGSASASLGKTHSKHPTRSSPGRGPRCPLGPVALSSPLSAPVSSFVSLAAFSVLSLLVLISIPLSCFFFSPSPTFLSPFLCSVS